MTKYDVIYEELQSQVESGDLTVETAEYLNDVAYEMYGDDELDDEEFTEAQKNRTWQKKQEEQRQGGKNASRATKNGMIKKITGDDAGAAAQSEEMRLSSDPQMSGAGRDLYRGIKNADEAKAYRTEVNARKDYGKEAAKKIATLQKSVSDLERRLGQAKGDASYSQAEIERLKNELETVNAERKMLIKDKAQLTRLNATIQKNSNDTAKKMQDELKNANELVNKVKRDSKNQKFDIITRKNNEIAKISNKADKNLKMGAIGGALAGTAAVGGTVLAYKGIKKHNAAKAQKQMIKNKISELEVMRDQAKSTKRKLELSKQIDELKAAI